MQGLLEVYEVRHLNTPVKVLEVLEVKVNPGNPYEGFSHCVILICELDFALSHTYFVSLSKFQS